MTGAVSSTETMREASFVEVSLLCADNKFFNPLFVAASSRCRCALIGPLPRRRESQQSSIGAGARESRTGSQISCG